MSEILSIPIFAEPASVASEPVALFGKQSLAAQFGFGGSHLNGLERFSVYIRADGGGVMRAKKTGFLQNESGATSVEYALLASMISLAVIPAAGTLGTRLTGVFDKAAVALDAPPSTAPSGGGGGGGSPGPMGGAPAI